MSSISDQHALQDLPGLGPGIGASLCNHTPGLGPGLGASLCNETSGTQCEDVIEHVVHPWSIPVNDDSPHDLCTSKMALLDGDESKPRAEPVDPGSAVAPASSNALRPVAPGSRPVAPVPKSVLRKRNAASHIDSDSMSQSSVGTSVSRAVSVRELQDKADRVRMNKRVEQARYNLRMLESERD